MSIKKRLTISNILIIVIPLVFSWCVAAFVLKHLDSHFGEENDYTLARSLGTVLLRNKDERLLAVYSDLEDKGYRVQFIIDGDTYYESEDFYEMYNSVVGEEFKIRDVGDFSISRPNGTVVSFALNDGYNKGNLTIVSGIRTENLTDNKIADNSAYYSMRSIVKRFVIGVVFVVVITISLITYMISRSILKPLKLLKEGTRQIKNGNLNYSIHYPKNDEFGEVCGDFEDMRLSLLALKEEERKYEENRKELIAGITHDLNTPLTSIKGYVSGILEGITNTEEKRTLYLQRINQTANKMSRLIEELLLYSTLDSNGVTFSFEKIDLVAYFNDCVQEMKEEIQESEMSLHFSSNCEKAYSEIDLMHFNRVVLNILGNSVKYKKEGNGNIYINIQKKEKEIEISFKDDGTGITINSQSSNNSNDLVDIFKVFYRGDKSRSQLIGGNGLGLAIVARIVSAHKGTLFVNKEYTGGLEIVIILPQTEKGECK